MLPVNPNLVPVSLSFVNYQVFFPLGTKNLRMIGCDRISWRSALKQEINKELSLPCG